MQFKKITKKALPTIKRYLADHSDLNSFYSLGVLYGWRHLTKLEYFLSNETIIFRGYNYTSEKIFFFPIGKSINALLAGLTPPYTLMSIPEEYAKENFPDAYIDENDFDYIYRFNDLLTLQGKKYISARNNLNHFKNQFPTYSYREIGKENIKDVTQVLRHLAVSGSSKLLEEKINYLILKDFFDIDLLGGILYLENRPIAFVIAEIRKDILYMHFEKGFHNLYRGCVETLRFHFLSSLKERKISLINREEDMGDFGLRVAKKRLGPIKLIYKYTIHR